MCIEYNECHYGGMYNINVKKKKEFCYYKNCAYECRCQLRKKRLKSPSHRSVTPSLDTHWVPGLGRHTPPATFDALIPIEITIQFIHDLLMTG